MTRRVSLFDSPYVLGFDEFERALDRISRSSSDGYPPYNIEQIGETGLRITIAVAGFDLDDLSVQLEQSQLVIRGRKQGDSEEDEDTVYLHRGIATRQFQRSFVLAEGIEVQLFEFKSLLWRDDDPTTADEDLQLSARVDGTGRL